MARDYTLEILAMIAIATLILMFLYTSTTMKNGEFSGTDDIAVAKMYESSGNSSDRIQPLIPQWVPPSAEIESTLFALQAAAGGILIGGIFGYWLGQKRKV
jgi:cobalt/nickel transport protein